MSAQVTYKGLARQLFGFYQFNAAVPNVPASDTSPLVFTMTETRSHRR
jgi:uncharacterized protein (TIGR03437 family)